MRANKEQIKEFNQKSLTKPLLEQCKRQEHNMHVNNAGVKIEILVLLRKSYAPTLIPSGHSQIMFLFHACNSSPISSFNQKSTRRLSTYSGKYRQGSINAKDSNHQSYGVLSVISCQNGLSSPSLSAPQNYHFVVHRLPPVKLFNFEFGNKHHKLVGNG